jgi:ribose 5-phosphate isomerase B
MRIAIASDHAGFACKQRLILLLQQLGHEVRDFGTHSNEPCDYPLVVRPAAEAVGRGTCDGAIVLGGSGNGEAIVANRIPGVRCAYVFDIESARLGRAHNNANAIAIGTRLVNPDLIPRLVGTWLSTGFEGGRHARRVALIDARW